YRPLPQSIWSYAKVKPCGAGCYSADLQFIDDDGLVIAVVEGFQVQRVQEEALKRAARLDPAQDWLYQLEWKPSGSKYPVDEIAAPSLLDPKVLAARIEPEFKNLGEAEGLPRYRQMLREVDRLCGIYIQHALLELGWISEAGQQITAKSLAAKLNVLPRYQRLLHQLLEFLR